MFDGLWVTPRHGRRPRDQATARAKRGTNGLHIDDIIRNFVLCGLKLDIHSM